MLVKAAVVYCSQSYITACFDKHVAGRTSQAGGTDTREQNADSCEPLHCEKLGEREPAAEEDTRSTDQKTRGAPTFRFATTTKPLLSLNIHQNDNNDISESGRRNTVVKLAASTHTISFT